MKRIILSLFALFLISLAACQKEITAVDDITPPALPAASAVLLKKYIRIDTTLTAPNDTIFTATYSYDNLKRCTRIFYKYFSHPEAIYEGTVAERLFYNGADTNISFRTMIKNVSGVLDSTSEYFTYQNNRVVKDSIGRPHISSFHYRYAGNVVHSVSYFQTNTDSTDYGIHHLQKLNGNIISERDTSYFVQGPWPYSNPGAAAVNARYDDHPNPLFKLSPPWPVLFQVEHYLQDGEFSMQQKNNKLRTYEEFDAWGPGESEEYIFQYTYLPNGYPSVARIHYVTNGGYWKGIYQY